MATNPTRSFSLAICALAAAGHAFGQSIPIGIIDFYGLHRTPVDRVRSALTFKEGDAIPLSDDERPPFMPNSEARLAQVPGIRHARVNLVCCESGQAIVYVGIEERGSATMTFRAAPKGDARLAPDVVKAGDAFSNALELAVQEGDATEDRSQGHALNRNAAMRAIQDRFVVYANTDFPALRRVVRTSSDAGERALAAQVIGYAADKAAVIDDLVYAMSDPAEGVRNSAMRALLVIAEMTPTAGKPVPRIPPQPFIKLLNSLVWSDRNKASGALMAFTKDRDPRLLHMLQKAEPISALAEMARWKSEGHAQAAFLILGRIAGYSDERALDLLRSGEREMVIAAATARK